MKKKRFCYIVEERGNRGDDEGEFITRLAICETKEKALKQYNKFKKELFKEDYFYTKPYLDNGDFIESTLITSTHEELPILSIEDYEEGIYYEMYICVEELI